MKKIIKNKVYDTDTAKLICREVSENGFIKELYQKKTGHFFIYHKMPTVEGTITPITYNDATEIAKQIMSADDYKDIFEGNSDDVNSVARISKATLAKLKRRIAVSNNTISDVINNLIKMEELFMTKVNFGKHTLDEEVRNIIYNIEDACYNKPFGCVVIVGATLDAVVDDGVHYRFFTNVYEIDYNNDYGDEPAWSDSCDVFEEDGFKICEVSSQVCVYGAYGDFDEDKLKNDRKTVEAFIREKLITGANRCIAMIAENK